MADVKVLYINSNGYPQEHSESADSIKMLSLKTANYELTDTKLGKLVDGADAANEHIHDGRYFRENEHLAATTGVADAGKPVKLDATGYLNPLIDTATLNAALDHGALSGLGDDDHTIYTKANGTRDFSGIVKYSFSPTFVDPNSLVTKKFVEDMHTGDEWFPYSALDFITDNTVAPPTEVLGDVYVLSEAGGAPHADYDGAAAGDIVRFNGTVWVKTTPTTGTKISIDDETNGVRLWTGSAWDQKYYESTTASTGLTKVGVDIRLDSSAAGDGLGFLAGVLSVKVAAAGGLEISSDEVQIKADGVKDTMIDFGTGAGQVSAVDVPIADAGNYTAQTEVEGALQELYGMVSAVGVSYTVGVGGVTKGYPVYISANDTVLAYTALSNTARIIGVAATTEAAAATVKVLANDTVVTGVLSGATAGTPYYWDGSALVTAIPGGGGSHVWKIGEAKNATDLHVEVEFIKKN